MVQLMGTPNVILKAERKADGFLGAFDMEKTNAFAAHMANTAIAYANKHKLEEADTMVGLVTLLSEYCVQNPNDETLGPAIFIVLQKLTKAKIKLMEKQRGRARR